MTPWPLLFLVNSSCRRLFWFSSLSEFHFLLFFEALQTTGSWSTIKLLNQGNQWSHMNEIVCLKTKEIVLVIPLFTRWLNLHNRWNLTIVFPVFFQLWNSFSSKLGPRRDLRELTFLSWLVPIETVSDTRLWRNSSWCWHWNPVRPSVNLRWAHRVMVPNRPPSFLSRKNYIRAAVCCPARLNVPGTGAPAKHNPTPILPAAAVYRLYTRSFSVIIRF